MPNLPANPRRASTRPAWLFDLDDTLYPAKTGLFAQVRARIGLYVEQVYALSPTASSALQLDYRARYGSTLAGLMAERGADPHDFLDFVHDVDYGVLREDRAFAAGLAALPGRKFVFTNGSADHAAKVMDRLGIASVFSDVFDIVRAGFVPKPEPPVYDAVIAAFELLPTETVLVEDTARNLAPAKARGMRTILVTDPASRTACEHADETIDDLPRWVAEQAGSVDSPPPPAIFPGATE